MLKCVNGLKRMILLLLPPRHVRHGAPPEGVQAWKDFKTNITVFYIKVPPLEVRHAKHGDGVERAMAMICK